MIRQHISNLVLTVGNSMMGDDGAGPLLFDLMEAEPVEGWQALNGGSAPENIIHHIREINPQRVLIVDAADFGLNPGDLRFIDKERIADLFIMSTHAMPLSFLMEALEGIAESVLFLGIQPDVVAFYYPMTKAVKDAVRKVHNELATGLELVPWLR